MKEGIVTQGLSLLWLHYGSEPCAFFYNIPPSESEEVILIWEVGEFGIGLYGK